jgi:DNA-binding GntR family transcriptional regulator
MITCLAAPGQNGGGDEMNQIRIDRTSPVPLWYQLARELERMITEGRLVKGGFLDNEIELAEQWQISRPTLRRAIQELVDSGMLVRQRGVGTQVVNAAPPPKVRLTSLYDELADAGRNPSTTVIVLEQVIPDLSIAESLGLAPGTPAVHLVRCRYTGTERMAILRTWLRVEDAGTLTVSQYRNEGLYSLLRNLGSRPHFAVQTIGARTASPVDAALLGLPVGAPLLTMKRVVQNITGVPIDVEENVYDATQHSLEMSVMES